MGDPNKTRITFSFFFGEFYGHAEKKIFKINTLHITN